MMPKMQAERLATTFQMLLFAGVISLLGAESSGRKKLRLAPWWLDNFSLRQEKWMCIPAEGSGGFSGSKPEQRAWDGPAGAAFVGGKNSDMEDGKLKADAHAAQLYDLKTDPNQPTNRYLEHPEIVAKMESRMVELKQHYNISSRLE